MKYETNDKMPNIFYQIAQLSIRFYIYIKYLYVVLCTMALIRTECAPVRPIEFAMREL